MIARRLDYRTDDDVGATVIKDDMSAECHSSCFSDMGFSRDVGAFVLVTGEVGEGKSSLIDEFQRQTNPECIHNMKQVFPGLHMKDRAIAGTHQRGTTKKVNIHPAQIGGYPIYFIDVPGFGDMDVKADVIMAQLDTTIFALQDLGLGLSGVLICKDPAKKLTTGNQLVLRYIDTLCSDIDKWSYIVLVGTKRDNYIDSRLNAPETRDFSDGVVEALAISDFESDSTQGARQCLEQARSQIPVRDSTYPQHTVLVNVEGRRCRSTLDLLSPYFCRMFHGADPHRLTCNHIQDAIFAERFADLFRRWRIELTAKSWSMVKAGEGFSGLAKYVHAGLMRHGLRGAFAGMEQGFKNFFSKTIEASLVERTQLRVSASSFPDHEFCALLSSIVYDVNNDAQLSEVLEVYGCSPNQRMVRLVLGEEASYRQPIAAVLVGEVLYVAWRGTQSVLDFVLDLHAQPMTPTELRQSVQHIQVHSGMWSAVAHAFATLFTALSQRISEEKLTISTIVFTGHSLGGGIALLALVLAYCSQQLNFLNLNIEQEQLELLQPLFKNVELHCVSFAAPMVLNFPHGWDEKDSALCAFLFQRSVNYVATLDIVPRLPGHLQFWRPALTVLVEAEVRDWVSKAFGCVDMRRFYADFARKNNLVALRYSAACPWLAYSSEGGSSSSRPEQTTDALSIDFEAPRDGSFGHMLAAHFFGEVAAGAAKQKLQTFLNSVLDPQMETMLSNYRHVGKIEYFSLEDSRWSCAQMRHDDFLGIPFPPSDSRIIASELLEYHSICPHCVGEKLIRKQSALNDFAKLVYSSYGFKEGNSESKMRDERSAESAMPRGGLSGQCA